ncbi:hypothetical protein F4804DRAFT_335855 [Jackrogersella minutella]|nr:hypothetical protein F4804DRAFT_335855 [Jackrogersella minutella]
MDQIPILQQGVCGDAQEQVSGKQFQRRSNSVPTRKTRSWAPVEEYSSNKKPQRSVTLNSKVKNIPSVIAQCVASIRGSQLISNPEDEDYDSDEEDRRNGVPIIVLKNPGCKITPAMTTNVRREIQAKREEKYQLQKKIAIPKQRYFEARGYYFENRGRDWTARMWSYFTGIEDYYFKMADKIYDLECEIGQLETKLASFLDHDRLPSVGRWVVNPNGTRIWVNC